MNQSVEKGKKNRIAKDADCPKNLQKVKEQTKKAEKIRHPRSGKSL